MAFIVLNEFDTTVRKALDDADPRWKDYEGLIICGTHTPQNVEEMIEAIKIAKEKRIPTLGICFGMQLIAIEHARSEMWVKDATSEEFGEGTIVIYKMPELRVGMYPVLPRYKLESHWHNYTLDKMFEPFASEWSKEGLIERIDIGNRIGVQYHPEYQSDIDCPHPLFVEFLNKCKTRRK